MIRRAIETADTNAIARALHGPVALDFERRLNECDPEDRYDRDVLRDAWIGAADDIVSTVELAPLDAACVRACLRELSYCEGSHIETLAAEAVGCLL